MKKVYQPQKHEAKTYQRWEKKKHFTPEIDSKRKPFCLIMPPPNANAPLHVGHALFTTIEDIIIRYHRMKGEPTLWLPGADHAGILTQVVFERHLEKEGKTRYDLGRKKFFEAVMEFTLKNKKTMEGQLRSLGASCDWTRNSFTLDPKFNRSIYTVFKKLYDDHLIYRDDRLVNWCPRCATALSDLEVEYQEEKAKLWSIKYPLKNTNHQSPITNHHITVATTRPETMLGDTAVAVNPEDKRYKDLVGETVILPLVGREIPIIADQSVDPEFGTGAVKVTPAHDPEDFEIGQRHHLEAIKVIGFDGKMNKNAKKYDGLRPEEARKQIVAALEKQELIEKREDYLHRVGHCERCETTIEPLISKQWFIKTKPLAQPAIEAVKTKKIKIIPQRFEKTYFHWMENIRHWCISRQLWWGHQLPVWYCGSENLSPLQKAMNKIPETKGCGEIIVAVEEPKKCPQCGRKLIRDPDTLDTWFSSGQWPYTTLGFQGNGKQSQDYQYFYPTSVMETGYEILFFWVARMIMLGLYATGKVPFETVYLHGLVRDALGQKMSKSKGNVLDPLVMTKKYGADALRMALILGNAPGTDFSLAENKIKGMRNFANKIWNAARFITMNLEPPTTNHQPPTKLKKEDKKMIKTMNKLIKNTTQNLNNFRFDLAAEEIYQVFWHQFCDHYIEATKSRRNSKLETRNSKQAARWTLVVSLKTFLKLLHPFMPFISEVIWQKVKNKDEPDLIVAPWPTKIHFD